MTTKKILSVLICLVMVLSLMPMAAFATETPCEHEQAHLNGQHTTECGYAEGVKCGHAHDNSCATACTHTCENSAEGCVLAKEAVCVHTSHYDNEGDSCFTACKHNCNDTQEDCTNDECKHVHTDECCRHDCATNGNCTPAVEAKCNHNHTDACYANCPHAKGEHDTSCGYVAASPCTFVCTEAACNAADTNTSPDLDITLSRNSYSYNGTEQKPEISVKSGGTDVSANDYSVSYTRGGSVTTDFINAGEITVTVKGSDNSSYNGKTDSAKYVITPCSVSVTVELADASYNYTGSEIKPTPTVQHSMGGVIPPSNYEVTYENNINVGTEAKVKVSPKAGGNYLFDEATKTFAITAATASDKEALTITAGDQSVAYGSAIDKTKYSVTSGSLPTNAVLTVTLTPSISTVGTGSIAVSNAVIKDAKGADITANYAISYVSGALTITPKSVDTPKIVLERTSYGYTGKAVTPTVTAVYDGNTLIPASEYTVSYENNVNLGTGTVKIVDKDGGNYTVSGYTTFSIVNNVGYKVVMGNGGCWYRGSYYGLGFRCDGPYADFLGITIDGQPVDKSYYVASEGSTNVGLYPQLLSMLGNGTHYITFKYTSGSATGVFYVGSTAINAVMTGDDSNAGLMALVMCLGVLSSVTILSVLRKKKSGAR